jgi:hypothetical protein
LFKVEITSSRFIAESFLLSAADAALLPCFS